MEKIYEVEVLKYIIKLLEKYNINHWLTDGTALKIYRDDILFPASDLDFGLFSSDMSKLLLLCDELKSNGYQISYQVELPFTESLILINPPKKCTFGPICFNIYTINNDEAILRNFDHPFRKEKLLLKIFALAYKLHLNTSISNKGIIQKSISHIPIPIRKFLGNKLFSIYEIFGKSYWFVIPIKYFINLKKINKFGMNFFIPNDIENYLEYRYGSSWQTPIKNWNKFECKHVRIRRLNRCKVDKYPVECDINLEIHVGQDIFAFNDEEINKIILRDKGIK